MHGINWGDQGGSFHGNKGRSEANIMQDGAFDLQHGTVVDEGSKSCIQGCHPK
jgi:hypothetical protein